MEAFLERYYSEVLDRLGDPSSSQRTPRDRLYADLVTCDRGIFNKLLKCSQQESILGFAEASVTIKSGQSRYPLPFGFRNFIALERYSPDNVFLGRIRSKPLHDENFGVEILSADRGFRLFPAVTLTADETWKLLYQRAPGPPHYAQAVDIGASSFKGSTPPITGGELHRVPAFYNGAVVHIFKADFGSLQYRTVKEFDATEARFHVDVPFDPVPSGDVWYEVCPTLPYPEDGLYALDVAILRLKDRTKYTAAEALKDVRAERWNSAVEYVASNVSDRGPRRIRPLEDADLMTSEIPWWWS